MLHGEAVAVKEGRRAQKLNGALQIGSTSKRSNNSSYNALLKNVTNNLFRCFSQRGSGSQKRNKRKDLLEERKADTRNKHKAMEHDRLSKYQTTTAVRRRQPFDGKKTSSMQVS